MPIRFEHALSPAALRQIYQMLTQMRATGRVVTPKDMEAAYRAVLQAEVQNSMRNRELQYQHQNQFRNWQLQKQMYEDKKSADSMAGLGMMGSMAGKFLMPNSKGEFPIGNLFSAVKKPFSGMFGGGEQAAPEAPWSAPDLTDTWSAPTPTEAMTDAISGAFGDTATESTSNLMDSALSGVGSLGEGFADAATSLGEAAFDPVSDFTSSLFDGFG